MSKRNLVPNSTFIEPFSQFQSLFFSDIEHEMNRFFDKAFGKNLFLGIKKDTGFPIVDAYVAAGYLVLEMPLAGCRQEDIEISEDNRILTIKGHMGKRKDANHLLKEVKRGYFERSFKLRDDVVGDAVATMDNGMLKICYKLADPEPEPVNTVKKIEILSKGHGNDCLPAHDEIKD